MLFRFRFSRSSNAPARRLHSMIETTTNLNRSDSSAVLVRNSEPVDVVDNDANNLYSIPVNNNDDDDNSDADSFVSVGRCTISMGQEEEAKNENVLMLEQQQQDSFSSFQEADRENTTVVIEMDTSTSVI